MINIRSLVVAILSFVFIAGIFWTTRMDGAATSTSSLTGLVAIKNMAQQSISYEIALANNKPTLLEFYADWCTTCQSMAPVLSKLHQEYGDRINFVMLNIDRPEWAQQLKQYGVTGIPQITFLDRGEEVVQTVVGRVPKTTLEEIMNKLSA
jgi:thiol-disulfide isomerase/thioredoxin